MTSTLSLTERQVGLALSILLALLGLVMAATARHGVMAVHGAMALGIGLWLAYVMSASFYNPGPAAHRMTRYYDTPTQFGIVMTLIWMFIGMVAGVWVAALLYWPEGTPPWPWTSFGRLRPVHTTGIIFGFGGNALIATSFHVL
ncbi:MAG: cbb3-type cytochrome c oxidase subunit I, partial [Sphingomonadaceae bacterium]